MSSTEIGIGRSRHKLTPVEIVLIVFFGGMVLAVVLPRIFNAENDANEAVLRTSMHISQIAIESYAADHSNKYPATMDDAVRSYFPGGAADGVTPASQGVLNPFTKKHEFPVLGKFPINPSSMRSQPPTSVGAARGEIVYVPLSDQRCYALVGTGGSGKALQGVDDKTTTVLSNLW